jgi:hypothetical protein
MHESLDPRVRSYVLAIAQALRQLDQLHDDFRPGVRIWSEGPHFTEAEAEFIACGLSAAALAVQNFNAALRGDKPQPCPKPLRSPLGSAGRSSESV